MYAVPCHVDKHMEIPDKQTGRQTGRQADRQMDRQTGRHTNTDRGAPNGQT